VRVGIGFDIHPLVSGRPLVLGGVRIEHVRGLMGHSDADVLLHAVCEALLGAVGEGDLGRHFPDADPRHQGVASSVLLQAVMEVVWRRGYEVENLDATVIAQTPRLSPHLVEMRRRIAALLEVPEDRVNVKAKSPEGIGALGAGAAIAAQAVVLLRER